jgi:hypothetical protein
VTRWLGYMWSRIEFLWIGRTLFRNSLFQIFVAWKRVMLTTFSSTLQLHLELIPELADLSSLKLLLCVGDFYIAWKSSKIKLAWSGIHTLKEVKFDDTYLEEKVRKEYAKLEQVRPLFTRNATKKQLFCSRKLDEKVKFYACGLLWDFTDIRLKLTTPFATENDSGVVLLIRWWVSESWTLRLVFSFFWREE